MKTYFLFVLLLIIGCQTQKSWYELSIRNTELIQDDLDNVPDGSSAIIIYSFLNKAELMERFLNQMRSKNIPLQESLVASGQITSKPHFIGQNTMNKLDMRIVESDLEMFSSRATIQTFTREGSKEEGQTYVESGTTSTIVNADEWHAATKGNTREGYAFFYSYQLAKEVANLMKFE